MVLAVLAQMHPDKADELAKALDTWIKILGHTESCQKTPSRQPFRRGYSRGAGLSKALSKTPANEGVVFDALAISS